MPTLPVPVPAPSLPVDMMQECVDLQASPALSDDAPESVPAPATADTGLEKWQEALSEHKGKLAMGVAATLGLIVFYQWRAKNLATQAPDDYQRLLRLRRALQQEISKHETAAAPRLFRPPPTDEP